MQDDSVLSGDRTREASPVPVTPTDGISSAPAVAWQVGSLTLKIVNISGRCVCGHAGSGEIRGLDEGGFSQLCVAVE